MKTFNKCAMINVMKLIYIFFLIFIITRFVRAMDMEPLNENIEITKEEINIPSCFTDNFIENVKNIPYSYHIFAFLFGAILNARKVIKIGFI